VYDELVQVEARSTGQLLAELREQMEPEEKARFDRQVEAEQQKLISIAQDHIELQALPIGNPDAVPKPQFRKKKKTHGLANARGLTGAEVAALELKAREELARARAAVTPEAEVIGILVQDTPPRPGGEFQGGPSVALAIRSPEGPPRAPPARRPITVDPVTFRLSQEDPYAPPASTAPPRLIESEGRPKRKRAPTRGRYKDAVAEG
jgi:hypothetical protein